jgi:hypothetical protein
MRRRLAALCITAIIGLGPRTAPAFGDEGHEIIALIADHFLEPGVRAKVGRLLDGDASALTVDRGMAAEATWADRYRDADRNSTGIHYRQTREWHYVDLEIGGPDLDAACFHHPALAPAQPASRGAAADCIVDKIHQFEGELHDPATDGAERLLALQFLLHLVGDLHQPLHAADAADQGGNAKQVVANGRPPGTLHHYWDTEFVGRLGADPAAVAAALIRDIGWWDRWRWRGGTVEDWTRESFVTARQVAYGPLPAPDPATGRYELDARYTADATRALRRQLQRAGVRLAAVLNRALR